MRMKLDEATRAYLAAIGAKGGKRAAGKGGKVTAANRTQAERSAAARKAVQARWARFKKKKAVPPAAD